MVVSLVTFASTGVVSLLSRGHKNERQMEELAYRQFFTKGRGTVDQMVQELDQAGTPASATSTATGGEADAEPTAANSNRVASAHYLVATPTQLIFDADIDHDGIVERVAYRLNGNTLERSVISKSADGTVSESRYEPLIDNVDNGSMPLFSYSGDPFGLVPSAENNDAVRILLLLRAPAAKSHKEVTTVGFEGVAHLPNAVAARQHRGAEQSEVVGTGDDSNIASSELPNEERYAGKWTMR